MAKKLRKVEPSKIRSRGGDVGSVASTWLSLQFLALGMVAAYLVGIYLSLQHSEIGRNLFSSWTNHGGSNSPSSAKPTTTTTTTDATKSATELLSGPHACYNAAARVFGKNIFENVSIVLHRNGEAVPCDTLQAGETGAALNFMAAMKATLATMDFCPDFYKKYQFESFLTRLFHTMTKKCFSTETDRSAALGFYGFCDMGTEKTPRLLDHDELIPIRLTNNDNGDNQPFSSTTTFLPCHFHTAQGVRVTSLPQLAKMALAAQQTGQSCSNQESNNNNKSSSTNENDGQNACVASVRELHLYAVPAGRVFMFATSYVGEIIPLPHVTGGDPTKPVHLQVLSLSPKVFDLVNFFSRDESTALTEHVLAETRESHRIKRSSTGATGYHLNRHRTSESGYFTSEGVAMTLKRRGFDVLGFDQYIESHADGLQVVRYNLTTAYRQHMDYLAGTDDIDHDYDSSGKGGNRFATILLYMTDLGARDGGETVFTEAWPPELPESERVPIDDAIRELRESGDGQVLQEGSWEEEMVALCRTRLAIQPHSSRALLFYSQLPNGTPDLMSRHGGCPVLRGTKYAANLWVWNTPRQGYSESPRNPRYQKKEIQTAGVVATFQNSGIDTRFNNAELYYEDKFWAKLGKNDPDIFVTTYRGNVWRVLVNGLEVQRWTIDVDQGTKSFMV